MVGSGCSTAGNVPRITKAINRHYAALTCLEYYLLECAPEIVWMDY